jgi:hypothetical protein
MLGQEPGAETRGRDRGQRPGAATRGSDLVHFGSAILRCIEAQRGNLANLEILD